MPFRAGGRDAGEGLDCVGVVLAAWGLPGAAVAADYRLGGAHGTALRAGLARWFVPVAVAAPGDVLLLRLAARRWHLAVKVADGMVHADAALRRVVRWRGTPGVAAQAWRRGREQGV